MQQGLSYLLVIAILCIYRTFPHHRALMHFPQIKALSIHSALGWGGRKSGHVYSGSFWYPKSMFQAFRCSKRPSPSPAKLSVSFGILPTQRAWHNTVSTGREHWCPSHQGHSPREGSSHCADLRYHHTVGSTKLQVVPLNAISLQNELQTSFWKCRV